MPPQLLRALVRASASAAAYTHTHTHVGRQWAGAGRGADNWPAGRRRPGLRWGRATTPEKDTQNEQLHQKLRLATSRARPGDFSNEHSFLGPRGNRGAPAIISNWKQKWTQNTFFAGMHK